MYLLHSRFGKKTYLKCVSSHFLTGNRITFGPLRMRCLPYIWTTLLITVHTFPLVVISLRIRKYTMLLDLAWLNPKKMGFTLFIVHSYKGWTAALDRCPLYYSDSTAVLPTQKSQNFSCDSMWSLFSQIEHGGCVVTVVWVFVHGGTQSFDVF